ncbi:hypothetical protein KZZ04_19475, partial [Pseudoalteromonas sp. CR1]|uniref:hypothetical protein n=1 Tax=Pseudoalteromonas sp. CR1 TaxID=2861964 RepID=UPI001C605436
ELSISVRADSKTLPNLEMMGQLNPNYAPIVQREPVTDSPKTPQRNRAKRQSDSRTGLKQRMRGGGNSANPKRTRKSAKPVKKSTRSR